MPIERALIASGERTVTLGIQQFENGFEFELRQPDAVPVGRRIAARGFAESLRCLREHV